MCYWKLDCARQSDYKRDIMQRHIPWQSLLPVSKHISLHAYLSEDDQAMITLTRFGMHLLNYLCGKMGPIYVEYSPIKNDDGCLMQEGCV